MAPGLFLRFVSSEVSEMIRSDLALAVLLLLSHAPVAAGERLALFPFELVNTGMLPTQPEETARLKTVEEITRQRLAEAGFRAGRHRAQSPRPQPRSAPYAAATAANSELARRVGAQLAAVGWVQKVSNLILNINLQIRDAHSGAMMALGSVDIRGNTDESGDAAPSIC